MGLLNWISQTAQLSTSPRPKACPGGLFTPHQEFPLVSKPGEIHNFKNTHTRNTLAACIHLYTHVSVVAAEKKMMSTKVFNGANVFMSRNLVPPELFDALHDALKHNGAKVFLCCDPSRNSSTDYHVISSPHHVCISKSYISVASI